MPAISPDPDKPKIGRPLKLTEIVTVTIREPGGGTKDTQMTRGERCAQILRTGNYREVAAKIAGLDRASMYAYLARGRADRKSGLMSVYSDFLDQVEKAEAESEADDIGTIKLAGNKSWQARAWLRERKEPEKWGLRTRVMIETTVRKEMAEDLVTFLASILEKRVTDPDTRVAIINDLLEWSTARSNTETPELLALPEVAASQ